MSTDTNTDIADRLVEIAQRLDAAQGTEGIDLTISDIADEVHRLAADLDPFRR